MGEVWTDLSTDLIERACLRCAFTSQPDVSAIYILWFGNHLTLQFDWRLLPALLVKRKYYNLICNHVLGLDPALPLFATFNNEWKLDWTDASFVDIIHTSALTFGKLEATGHVDFYVNGGTNQPFCYNAKCKTK